MDLVEYVDDLFLNLVEKCQQRKAAQPIVENPVDAGQFVLGLDPIAPQKRRALTALNALADFALSGPAYLQPLPLSHAAREARKSSWDEHRILALYARSWASTGYNPCHPGFEDYACGILALPNLGSIFRQHNPAVMRQYPPRQLKGLAEDSYVTISPWRDGRRRVVNVRRF